MSNPPLKAQYYFYNDRYYENDVLIELGASIGIMNCFTDLGGKKGIGKNFIKDLNWKNTKPSAGIYVMGMYQYKIGVRLEATFGSIAAYDSILKPVAPSTHGRYERNLSFKSTISDIQLSFEIHPLFIFGNYINKEPPRYSPYLVAGIGYFSFNPQTSLNGNWYYLAPLHTEGEGFSEYPDRKPYKLSQFNIPVGAGVKYEINSVLNASLELVHRVLFTDYLDDVSTSYIDPDFFSNHLSGNRAAIARRLYDRQGELNSNHVPIVGGQRGDPGDKDAFFSIQLKMGLVLGRKKR